MGGWVRVCVCGGEARGVGEMASHQARMPHGSKSSQPSKYSQRGVCMLVPGLPASKRAGHHELPGTPQPAACASGIGHWGAGWGTLVCLLASSCVARRLHHFGATSSRACCPPPRAAISAACCALSLAVPHSRCNQLMQCLLSQMCMACQQFAAVGGGPAIRYNTKRCALVKSLFSF